MNARTVAAERAGGEGRRARLERLLRDFHEDSPMATAGDVRLLARLWPYLQRYQGWLWLIVGMTLLTAAGSLYRPVVMLQTIDEGVKARDLGVLLRGGLVFAAIIVLEQILGFAQIYATQIVGARATARLRQDAFRHLHSLRVGYFDRQPVGRLVTRVTNDVDAILELFASGALTAIGDLVRLVGIVVLMFLLDANLALIAFAVMPPTVLLMVALRTRVREAFRQIRGKTSRMNADMNEQVTGMAVIQAYNHEAQSDAEFDVINRGYRDANLQAIKYEAMQDAAIELLAALSLAAVVLALGAHGASFGVVVAFNAYLVQFFEPVAMLTQRYTLLQSALAGAERVFALLDVKDMQDAPVAVGAVADESTRAKGGDALADSAAPALEFDGVSFAYQPGRPVLQDVSFRVGVGEKVALVGATGAGKSTVGALALRLYDVDAGAVRVGGRDVRTLGRDELRRGFSVVPQDVQLFPGTVADNVAAGSAPDRERVREALRRVGALDLFEARENGLDTAVQEQGGNFSAGERQLLAFARAVYRDAPLLLLDEATASVDSNTEARLHAALETLLSGRSAVIIAHRLSTIRSADRILVFHKGRIAEQGRHQELLALGGLYARLHALQELHERQRAAG